MGLSNYLSAPTQAIPYTIVYEVEAVLPLERQISSLRIAIQEILMTGKNARLRIEEPEALDETNAPGMLSNSDSKVLQQEASKFSWHSLITGICNSDKDSKSSEKGSVVSFWMLSLPSPSMPGWAWYFTSSKEGLKESAFVPKHNVHWRSKESVLDPKHKVPWTVKEVDLWSQRQSAWTVEGLNPWSQTQSALDGRIVSHWSQTQSVVDSRMSRSLVPKTMCLDGRRSRYLVPNTKCLRGRKSRSLVSNTKYLGQLKKSVFGPKHKVPWTIEGVDPWSQKQCLR
ncbi:unnamed protein product [Fraxinus pennsylvanica]|uniref:Uncharacterized protein n=1 Tax=Fraxinus pennsylvanica TaxID=56036 RepID=A0AAD1ZJH7_9LAMI|nr:unnamed protein product [Fraxinus pennsylvanica]